MKLFRVLLLLCFTLHGFNAFAATLSERTYKKLTKIHVLMGESKYSEALRHLDVLLPKVKKNQYEYATIMQTYGYAYAAKDQYRKAVKAFTEALDTNALPEQVQHAMRYNLAQMLTAVPDYNAAANAYEAWFANAEKPSVESFVFAATVYAQLKQYKKAISKIKTAISRSAKPKETWYQLLLSMYYEQRQYNNAAATLESMVALWPDTQKYWKQLSGVYFTLKKSRKALAILELSNKRGFLTEEKDLMNLVNLYLLQNSPYKGALLLEKEINSGRISETGKNLQKLAESFMRAKETDEALNYFSKSAEKQNKGKLFLQMSQLYSDREDWPKTIQSADKALATGNLKNPGSAHLLNGLAYFEQGKKKKAMASFRKGTKYAKSRKQADRWINHLNNSQ